MPASASAPTISGRTANSAKVGISSAGGSSVTSVTLCCSSGVGVDMEVVRGNAPGLPERQGAAHTVVRCLRPKGGTRVARPDEASPNRSRGPVTRPPRAPWGSGGGLTDTLSYSDPIGSYIPAVTEHDAASESSGGSNGGEEALAPEKQAVVDLLGALAYG